MEATFVLFAGSFWPAASAPPSSAFCSLPPSVRSRLTSMTTAARAISSTMTSVNMIMIWPRSPSRSRLPLERVMELAPRDRWARMSNVSYSTSRVMDAVIGIWVPKPSGHTIRYA